MTRLRCTECPSGAGSDEGECFPRTVPQASAIPGFATARLWKYIFHYITTSCARSSTSWDYFWKAPERPAVTKPLPAQYKPVENIGRTCQAPQFGGRAIGCATTTLPIRVPRLLRRAVRCQGRIGEFQLSVFTGQNRWLGAYYCVGEANCFGPSGGDKELGSSFKTLACGFCMRSTSMTKESLPCC